MNLLDLSADFVKKLNALLQYYNTTRNTRGNGTEQLIDKINEVQQKLVNSESKIEQLLCKLEKNKVTDDKTFYVVKGDKLYCILQQEVSKPQICKFDRTFSLCGHQVFFKRFMEPRKVVYVNYLSQLQEVDRVLEDVYLEVFDHWYRSYDGFCCYISIRSFDGITYIVDAIKLRSDIPNMRLLTCEVKKLIHCRECVKRLIADFKTLGCYRNLNLGHQRPYVDWRIRPINDKLKELLQNGVLEMNQHVNQSEKPEQYVPEDWSLENEISRFVEEYNIDENSKLVAKLLELRNFIAKDNDESVQYVMTDNQLIDVLDTYPTTQEEFLGCLNRISPLVRQHIDDFLLLITDRKSSTILERLAELHKSSTLTQDCNKKFGQARKGGDNFMQVSDCNLEHNDMDFNEEKVVDNFEWVNIYDPNRQDCTVVGEMNRLNNDDVRDLLSDSQDISTEMNLDVKVFKHRSVNDSSVEDLTKGIKKWK